MDKPRRDALAAMLAGNGEEVDESMVVGVAAERSGATHFLEREHARDAAARRGDKRDQGPPAGREPGLGGPAPRAEMR